MTSVVLPDLIVGPIALLAGILVFIFRRQIRDQTVSSEKTVLGEKRGGSFGRLQTPFWVGFAGLGGVAIGLLMITGGVLTAISGPS